MVGVRTQHDRIARDAGWAKLLYPAGPFTLQGYEHFTRPGGTLTVYIESDGTAWLGRHTLSRDPTPAQAVVLPMAVQDPSPNTLYLARPCQFLDDEPLRRCDPAYWSSKRFAPEVIDGYREALDLAKQRSGASQLRLVGYSGGGAVAALIAGQRPDVVSLITAAGTLDHEIWTRRAGVSPLDGSLNPPDFAAHLRTLPQVHFVGDKDTTVPPYVAQSYAARLGDTRLVTLVPVAGYDHDCCWERNWRDLLAQYVQ